MIPAIIELNFCIILWILCPLLTGSKTVIRKFHHIVGLIVFIGAQPAIAKEPWVLDGFEMPESVLVDSEREQLIVSSIVGNPKGLADISSNKETLYLPLMLDGQVKEQLISARMKNEVNH